MAQFVFTILPYIAVFALCFLFSVPGIWGFFFTTSLLAHKTQWLGLDKDKEEK